MSSSALHDRALDVVRLGWGIALLTAAPSLVVAADAEPTPLACGVARVLGARQVLEAAALLGGRRRSPRLRRAAPKLGATIDALHALSAFGLAALTDSRRAWTTDGAIAATFAAATWRSAA